MAFQSQTTSLCPLQLLKWGALASRDCSIPCKWDAKMITKKMAEMVELPFEVLSTIITILTMSSDGARGLVRASANCKMLMTHARQPDVLRVVNFSHGCEEHFHRNGLLFSCVRAGNLAAEYLLGKAVLYIMAFPVNQTPLFAFLSSNGISQHQRLVRSFLCEPCISLCFATSGPLLDFMRVMHLAYYRLSQTCRTVRL